MYQAREDKVWVMQDGRREIFLTIHPTDTGGTTSVERQAVILADILNSAAGGRGAYFGPLGGHG